MDDQNWNKVDRVDDLIDAVEGNEMNNEDLKTILAAARPNGMDRNDPLIGEALRHVDGDPALRDWFLDEQKRDAEIGAAFADVRAPAGLKDRILAMADVQRRAEHAHGTAYQVEPAAAERPRPWWAMAAAAVLLVAGTVTITEMTHRYGGEETQVAGQPETVVTPLTGGAEAVFADWQSDAIGSVEGLLARRVDSSPVPAGQAAGTWLNAQLASARSIGEGGTAIANLEAKLARTNPVACLTVDSPTAGRYALICFKLDGVLMHLAVFERRKDLMPGSNVEVVQVRSDGRWHATAWNQQGRTVMLFALVDDVESADTLLQKFSSVDVAAAW